MVEFAIRKVECGKGGWQIINRLIKIASKKMVKGKRGRQVVHKTKQNKKQRKKKKTNKRKRKYLVREDGRWSTG